MDDTVAIDPAQPSGAPPPAPTHCETAQDDPIPPVFTDDLLRMMIAALPSIEHLTDEQRSDRVAAAMLALRAFDPKEPIEAMLATHAVLAHHAALTCYRRAAHGNQPAAIASRLFGSAATLSRTLGGMLRNLEERRERSGRQSGRNAR
jgi:hypothetical protein